MTQSTVIFDRFADDYDHALNQGISISGEDKDFFANGRIVWLSGLLAQRGIKPQSIMDFGCGTGSGAPHLLEILKPQSLLGVDVSAKSLALAQEKYGSERVRFSTPDHYVPREEIDLAFCNGVFHHIPVTERADSVSYVYRSLKESGIFAFWENNPWNPGARYCMKKNPFDKDAIAITPPEARALLKGAGFKVLRTDYLFIFPRTLRWFRGIEPFLSQIPLGAQYQILCGK